MDRETITINKSWLTTLQRLEKKATKAVDEWNKEGNLMPTEISITLGYLGSIETLLKYPIINK